MIQLTSIYLSDGWQKTTNQIDITPLKFNIDPEKWGLEDEFPFGIAYF